jgi:hypothetical protein
VACLHAGLSVFHGGIPSVAGKQLIGDARRCAGSPFLRCCIRYEWRGELCRLPVEFGNLPSGRLFQPCAPKQNSRFHALCQATLSGTRFGKTAICFLAAKLNRCLGRPLRIKHVCESSCGGLSLPFWRLLV